MTSSNDLRSERERLVSELEMIGSVDAELTMLGNGLRQTIIGGVDRQARMASLKRRIDEIDRQIGSQR